MTEKDKTLGVSFYGSLNNDNNLYHFFLKAKHIDIKTGSAWVALINKTDAERLGIMPGDELHVEWKEKTTEISVDVSEDLVSPGEIGLFTDIIEKYNISEQDLLKLSFAKRAPSLKAIYKKLQGKKLNFNEINQIVKDIVERRLNNLEVAFFIAPSFNEKNFSLDEIFSMTKSVATTGDNLKFGEVVADKHSTGGLPGNRITPLIVSIVGSLGICIPKTSSRAITSPAGTADAMETIMRVDFETEQIKKIVKENNACLVWGGALKLAPADDIIIEITRDLGIEPYSKMVVSVMSKKVAMGVTHLIIDIPVSKGAKIPDMIIARKIERLFLFLAKKFNIKTQVLISKTYGPIGRGIGPALEVRDVLRVLQQKENRPLDLEVKAINQAGKILEMTKKAKKGKGQEMAKTNLKNGLAFQKMMSIIKSQQGDPTIDSEDVKVGPFEYQVKALQDGQVNYINNRELVEICNLLGTPKLKGSGVYLDKTVSEKYKKGDVLFTMYSESENRLNMAINVVANLKSIYK